MILVNRRVICPKGENIPLGTSPVKGETPEDKIVVTDNPEKKEDISTPKKRGRKKKEGV